MSRKGTHFRRRFAFDSRSKSEDEGSRERRELSEARWNTLTTSDVDAACS